MLLYLIKLGLMLVGCVALPCMLGLFVIARALGFVRRLGRSKPVVGFFHPYCHSGGGGERVLWVAVDHLLENTDVDVVIYTGDKGVAPGAIIERASTTFGLEGLVAKSSRVRFVYLSCRKLVEAAPYPRFTLLGQSLGSMILGVEALCKEVPTIFYDTTGFAFTHPIARWLFGCKVACYVHYPTISTDMLRAVREQRPMYNNDQRVAGSVSASKAKLLYYRAFACLYSCVGRAAHVVMVNSSWTSGHIKQLWSSGQGADPRITTVYPPCNTTNLQTLPLDGPERVPLIISIGQFRPEKDHHLQLQAYALFAKARPSAPKLVMIGGARDDGDWARVAALQQEAKALGLEDSVQFAVNVPFSELKGYLGRATVGLHTMWNEHFGIGCVEFQAAGVIVIAHNSGGPKMDIVVEHEGTPTGFRATSPQEYADAMSAVFAPAFHNQAPMRAMREAARAHASLFSDEAFNHGCARAIRPLL